MNEITMNMPAMFAVDEAGTFRDTVKDYINSGQTSFLLDFKDCLFIDSTGLGVIVSLYKKCAENGGTIRLRTLHPNVRKIFELTRLTNVFEII